MHYRAHIDGLRCIAVLAVLLFHLEVSNFPGGFVGVDVFLVISGYLITKGILSETNEGKFRLLSFYERRVRRIIPALFAVILFVALVAPFVLLPQELRFLPAEIVGGLAFVANIVFWMNTGYFAVASERMPLLHLWSLGLEEQFYIIFPLFFIFLLLKFPARLKLVISAGALLSLALCVIATPIKPSASFFLLPTRAWEFLIGSILAIGIPPLRNRLVREIGAGLGIVLVGYSILFFDADMNYPGASAIVPVLGASMWSAP